MMSTWWDSLRARALPVVGVVPLTATPFCHDVARGQVFPVTHDPAEAEVLWLLGAFAPAAWAPLEELRMRMQQPARVLWCTLDASVGTAPKHWPAIHHVRGLPPPQDLLLSSWRSLWSKP
jgi:hypothetical protein